MSAIEPGELLGKRLQIPAIFREFLETRGIAGDEALNRFLFPRLVDLPKPEAMKNLKEASVLIAQYVITGKKIVIWGDYDVDGTTGTALLVNFFRELGIAVSWHIPNRLEEGYGLNVEWFQTNRIFNDFLLISVDCGTSNKSEIAEIKAMGGNVIVTDHHSLPLDGLPDCLLLNPSQETCGFYREQLAGVGVAFYLIAGIRAQLLTRADYTEIAASINLKQYLAFVALGTIADIVELTTTNRILVRAGMEALGETKFPGLFELLTSCGIEGGQVISEEIGYLIGPKINAAGRLGESDLVVALLTEHDRTKAKLLASKLTELNDQRRKISADNFETALTKISQSHLSHFKCVIIKEQLHQGVAGIVASKLVEIYGYPVIVFAEKTVSDGSLCYVGSARSIDGINIVEMIRKCSGFVERFGGHKMAAGLTVSAAHYESFSSKFSSIAKQNWENRKSIKSKRFDIECSVETIMSNEYLNFMKLLEPFGPGNLQPIFIDNKAEIIDSRVVGKTSEHLQLTIRGKLSNLKGIGFALGNKIHDIQKHSQRSLVYAPTINRFRGNVSWQVRVIEV